MLNFLRRRLSYKNTAVAIGSRQFSGIVSDSFLKRMIGLMYRSAIAEDECMLFIFNEEARLGIWMKNMNFPIDVIWLDSDMRIVSMVEGIQPCHRIICKTYYPEAKSKYIIELKSGSIEKNRISKATKISIAAL